MKLQHLPRLCLSVLAASFVHLSAQAQAPAAPTPAAPALKPLKLIVFDGGWNLPLWAAQRQGYFNEAKLAVDMTNTPNSVVLVKGIMEGRYDIAFAGIDNVIGYQEGQGEVPLENPDMFAFMGGDNGMLSVMAAPAIRKGEDLKGKSLSVDAMNTGFAFVLRDFVARSGLSQDDVKFVRAGSTSNRFKTLLAGENDATLLRTPFDLMAKEKGFTELAAGKSLGNYQGTVGLTTRRWAAQNEDALVNFIRAYRKGLEFIYDPKNRAISEALLVANTRDITPELAKSALTQLLENGLQRNPAFNVEGIRTVLALRSKYGTPQKQLTDPMKYIDSRYLEKAGTQ
ncbi:ABC-type nitrate/sulfonate/bicarbonate transport system, substrate-binding protein [Noviherbaspirillum humi]|uniref:ABC-type nitrate/sulfonate/bicarbonate transport system, substrate-binding protein n=1 Tax=Noviherbaspirillum humi TaxID=1688639 RepID=A0A239JZ53_9BURK|nr:ABC transporter substrate-binding protein [Noviherbaspirillum humi]SNT11306.1 ABC-type nitrate/sulfonate/bicarbonate transport system, substrate-binding protein [Noviherbaspirillum humi]